MPIGYMVCANRQEADRVFNLARKMDIIIPLPITYSEFIENRYHGVGVKKLHIDDADMLLRQMGSLGGVEVATIVVGGFSE